MASYPFRGEPSAFLLSAALGLLLLAAPCPVRADSDDTRAAAAVAGEIAHSQDMGLLFPDRGSEGN